MDDIVQRLVSLSIKPSAAGDLDAWLGGGDAADFLLANLADDDTVIYAGVGSIFIHAVCVPEANIEPLDVGDLLSWNFGLASASSGFSIAWSDPPRVEFLEPFERTGTKAYERAQPLLFLRSFSGRPVGDHAYIELAQPFLHAFGLHHVTERNAYCRIDDRGDVADLIRIVRVPGTKDTSAGRVVTCRRSLLDDWMLMTGQVLLRMFDVSRLSAGFDGWSDDEPTQGQDQDMYYRRLVISGGAGYIRGCQIIRSRASATSLRRRFGFPREEDRRYESFVAQDWKNKCVIEISTAPGSTANYFTESQLPFETSPAFFRPEVLLKYKSDREKYRIDGRAITCRDTWHLQAMGVNGVGQVFAYIVYLRSLPHEEQLHWKAYNEPPKAGLPRSVINTDFEGRWDVEPEPLESLKDRLEHWKGAHLPWWSATEDRFTKVSRPVTSAPDEWADEILYLFQLLVEGFDAKWLRQAAAARGRRPADKLGSLRLVEECLIALGFEEERAREVTTPLHRLNEFRKIKAHHLGSAAIQMRQAVIAEYGSYTKHFDALCGECDEAVRIIGEAFKGMR